MNGPLGIRVGHVPQPGKHVHVDDSSVKNRLVEFWDGERFVAALPYDWLESEALPGQLRERFSGFPTVVKPVTRSWWNRSLAFNLPEVIVLMLMGMLIGGLLSGAKYPFTFNVLELFVLIALCIMTGLLLGPKGAK